MDIDMTSSTADQHAHCFCTQNTAGEICCCECGITETHAARIIVTGILTKVKDEIEGEDAIYERIKRKDNYPFGIIDDFLKEKK